MFYFRQVPLLTDTRITEILEVGYLYFPPNVSIRLALQVLCKCLDDDVVEVREMAATYVR